MDLSKWINQYIKKVIMEDFRYHYDRNPFIPDFMVADTAGKALNAVQKNNLAGRNGGNEGSGIEKAKSLSAQEPMTHQQLKRMKAFFDNNKEIVQSEKMAGKSLTDSEIIQKWELWGGDAGYQWVERQIKNVQKTNDQSKNLRPKGNKRLMDPHNTRTHDANHFFN